MCSSDLFRPREMVYIEEPPTPLPLPLQKGDRVSTARIISYTEDEIEIEATLSRPGVLVTSEVYYPGWRAEVDGVPANILRANKVFRAVALDAGAHTVRFQFRPNSFLIGRWISLVSVGLLLAYAVYLPRRGSATIPSHAHVPQSP